ncbi:MAG: DegT/DnrJ/EryC1/StrS family aminotransferase [Alphaproteobacteria bacterium]|nr:DegT/DnrJ/EryC1/StrS family aminotransferase [Alphaproteobacteria bacterium]
MKLPAEAVFASPELRPKIHLSPLSTGHLEYNLDIGRTPISREIDWDEIVPDAHRHRQITRSGREALALALRSLDLRPNDEVLIATTEASPYISRCVTDAVDALCSWSLSLSPRTKCIILIHSFGFRATVPQGVADSGLPIIEDCAYGFGLRDSGRSGDFAIYSFPKAFPVPFGGMLLSKAPVAEPSQLTTDGKQFLLRLLAHYFTTRAEAYERRWEVFREYIDRFAKAGLPPLMTPKPGEVPHAFVMKFPDEERATRVRKHMDGAGVESSVYYGSGGYYLPCHQNLGPGHLDYITRWFEHAMSQEPPL